MQKNKTDVGLKCEELLGSIKMDLFEILTLETNHLEEGMQQALSKLANDVLDFYILKEEQPLMIASMFTLKERILTFFYKGNFLEAKVYAILESRLDLKAKYFKKLLELFKTESTYMLDFEKIKRRAMNGES